MYPRYIAVPVSWVIGIRAPGFILHVVVYLDSSTPQVALVKARLTAKFSGMLFAVAFSLTVYNNTLGCDFLEVCTLHFWHYIRVYNINNDICYCVSWTNKAV